MQSRLGAFLHLRQSGEVGGQLDEYAVRFDRADDPVGCLPDGKTRRVFLPRPEQLTVGNRNHPPFVQRRADDGLDELPLREPVARV